jgi:hypothetical protein
MLSWPDALCEGVAQGGRRVVRYDLRDSGESTTADPGAPAYTLRDLAADAGALDDALARIVRGGCVGKLPGCTKLTAPRKSGQALVRLFTWLAAAE